MKQVELLVEGDFDAALLNPLLANGGITVVPSGSKTSLAPQVRQRRSKRTGAEVYFLRDRDFDFLPETSSEVDGPTEHTQGESRLGWRWKRHEIENYLLEPAVVASALNASENLVREKLRMSAEKIRAYEAARWTIGQARSRLEQPYRLQTRKDDVKEFEVPTDLTADFNRTWMSQSVDRWRNQANLALEPETLLISFDHFLDQFTDDFCQDTKQVLVWFSGKDLAAGMAPYDWFESRTAVSAKGLLKRLRDWARAHPDEFLQMSPEVAALRDLLQRP